MGGGSGARKQARGRKRAARRQRVKRGGDSNVVGLSRPGIPTHPKPDPANPQTIMLAVPTVDGTVNWSIASLFGLANGPKPDSFPFKFITHIEGGARGIDHARNRIVAAFKQVGADWLIMVDADQVVPPNIWQLCTVLDADIVAGLTYTWYGTQYKQGRLRVNHYGVVKHEGEPTIFNLTPPDDLIAKGQPYRVDIVGTGAIAIRRSALEKMKELPFYFTYRPDMSIKGGEDVNFSVDARRLGLVIAVHPGVVLGHNKTIDLAQVKEYYDSRHEFDNKGLQHDPYDMLSVSLTTMADKKEEAG